MVVSRGVEVVVFQEEAVSLHRAEALMKWTRPCAERLWSATMRSVQVTLM